MTQKPTLTIVRGLPGSGKSTLAHKLTSDGYHFESDMFFIDHSGHYKFNQLKIKEAHEWCKTRVEEVMREDYLDVIVSNTFTQMCEYRPYIDLAKKYGFLIQIIECHGRFGSIHNVPKDVIQRMEDRWENTNWCLL